MKMKSREKLMACCDNVKIMCNFVYMIAVMKGKNTWVPGL